MSAKDTVFVAEFIVNKYLVSFVIDGDTLSSDSLSFGNQIIIPEVPEKEGYNFSGWREVPATMPAKELTFTGSYTINKDLKYNLIYMLDGVEYKRVSVAFGDTIVLDEALTKEGHTFSGWSEVPKTMPLHDVTVTGKFTANSYTLTYVLDGETFQTGTVVFGTTITTPEVPAKEGYTFDGWIGVPETMPAKNVTVTGSYTINKYTLTYTVGGETYKTAELEYGANITAEVAPAKEGHTFSGWGEIPSTMPAKDVTIAGTFIINVYKVTYILDGETFKTEEVPYGTVIPTPEVPAKEGYIFGGWGEVATTMPAQDLTYTADYILNKEQTDGQGLTYLLNGAKDAFAVSGYTDGLVADVTIPESLYDLPVTALLNGALEDAEVLKTLTIPNSVAGVGEDALSGCHNLLVVEWNATAPLLAECFDGAEAYGNMLVFATKEASSISFDGNVVVDGVAEEIVLTDGMPFRNPKDFTAEYISYSREFTKKTKVGVPGGWEGIVLPFAVQTIISEKKGILSPFGAETEGLPCWVAQWLTGSRSFMLTPSNLANQPFIMEVPNSEDYGEKFNIDGVVEFMAENVAVEATVGNTSPSGNGFTLQGSYEGVRANEYTYALNDEVYITNEGTAYLPGGVFVADSRDVRPFEAYVYNNLLTRLRYFSIEQGSNANSIPVEMLKDDRLVDVYTLQGILIRSQMPIKSLEKELPRGIYIVNGMKIVVK